MKQQPNYYATLSADVRYDSRLKPNVKLLFAEINALCNMNAECFASNKYFADLYSKEKGTISGWISQLVKYEYITIKYKYIEGTRQISHRYIKIINGGILKKSNTLCDKNQKSNNTSININLTDSNNKGRFKKPTVNEIAEYCIERKNNIDAETFYDFYESKDWKIGKNKMKAWKACVRTWEKRQTKNNNGGMSKIHSHLQKNMNVKEKLKQQLKK
jgi:hypothetical protein